ncbi:MAG TPA: glycoside hydrolase family protein [Accumulibacter sp.]|uniref:glycoside hydrolase family protein n=1 Tax=Accumulibacter sp. TaxID=2053492 RepID=UPI002C67E91C|nr:DUF4384 domain-containing protein [Accumulibacter sp.]HRD89596.1 glycoside hydrolase family protein [Accumulibacter sp.]
MKNGIVCRIIACAVAGSLAWAVGAVPAAAQNAPLPQRADAGRAATPAERSFRRITEDAALLAGGLSVQLDKALLREGDALVVTIDVPHEGYLNVVSIGPDDVPTVLFPNRFHPDNRVVAGLLKLPSAQMTFDIKATKPYGPTLVAAFLGKEALDFYQQGAGQRDVQGRMQERFARLSAASGGQLADLAAKSFAVAACEAPLLGGAVQAQVCAANAPCDAQGVGESGDLPSDERLTPGILLEPEVDMPLPKGVMLRRVYGKGIRLTKLSEGFVPRLYNDAARYCSIAYGHLIKKAPCDGSEPAVFRRGVTEPQGEALLVEDMRRAQRAVMSLVKTVLSDGQYAALCDFTYNVGVGNLQRSTLLKVVNADEHHRVPAQLRRWTKAGGREFRGLKIRREREIALYFEGMALPKALPGEEELPAIDIRAGESVAGRGE